MAASGRRPHWPASSRVSGRPVALAIAWDWLPRAACIPHQDHAAALATLLSQAGIPTVVHAFTDGRDTPPRSAKADIERLMQRCRRWFRLRRCAVAITPWIAIIAGNVSPRLTTRGSDASLRTLKREIERGPETSPRGNGVFPALTQINACLMRRDSNRFGQKLWKRSRDRRF
jgi:BPG-independent PGAM N-terminus (iPGM_N)